MEVVVSAIAFLANGRAYVARRAPLKKSLGGHLEFPGGKVKAGESPRDAAVREVNEELGVSLEPEILQELGTFVVDGIALHVFTAAERESPSAPFGALTLNAEDHSEGFWLDSSQLREVVHTDVVAPADVPAFAKLAALLEKERADAELAARAAAESALELSSEARE